MIKISTRVLGGFDDPTFGREEWQKLLTDGGSDIIYLTWHYQRTWWETFKRGELLLIVAERDGQPVALAPFYAESGMVYFLASEFESDYLNFIGDVSDPRVLDALLTTAINRVPEFAGFRLYFVPSKSGTGKALEEAANRLCLSCYGEEDMSAPVLDLAGQRAFAMSAVNKKKKSLLQHESYFRRNGSLEVHHLHDGEEILLYLDEFFEQHKARYSYPANPSRFHFEKVPLFIKRFTQAAAKTGWLRFTRIDWEGRHIAFHYGFCYRGRFFWGISSFDTTLARHSPGQVMLRQLLLAAMAEGAHTFDFGTGAADFKLRFATQTNAVHTWGLYPSPTLVKAREETRMSAAGAA
jgi:CelD/BcsL family acetyltransferase involved in cellulose biosynthesis